MSVVLWFYISWSNYIHWNFVFLYFSYITTTMQSRWYGVFTFGYDHYHSDTSSRYHSAFVSNSIFNFNWLQLNHEWCLALWRIKQINIISLTIKFVERVFCGIKLNTNILNLILSRILLNNSTLQTASNDVQLIELTIKCVIFGGLWRKCFNFFFCLISFSLDQHNRQQGTWIDTHWSASSRQIFNRAKRAKSS